VKPEIIAATIVVVRYPNARVCAECQKPISGRLLRVAEKRDGVVSVFTTARSTRRPRAARVRAEGPEGARGHPPQGDRMSADTRELSHPAARAIHAIMRVMQVAHTSATRRSR
jgi:hypothetical protein